VSDFRELLRLLADSQVEFILIGGVAATVHGSARLTEDVDVVYRRSSENIERVAQALGRIHPYLRGAPPGLPFRWDSETIFRGLNFTLVTDLGAIDLLGAVTGGGPYEDIVEGSDHVSVFGIDCLCVSLDQLIRFKRAAGRPKDLEALAELEAIREERAGGQQ
jgi:predicted nucleotidyltransferase